MAMRRWQSPTISQVYLKLGLFLLGYFLKSSNMVLAFFPSSNRLCVLAGQGEKEKQWPHGFGKRTRLRWRCECFEPFHRKTLTEALPSVWLCLAWVVDR